ncbi:MAG: hypothetical protein A2Y24_03575 [Clostridiales bacterium GWE2_32_10]|nr:MAG: hypothetical protein A2Y24_03575 [Clostridiales bacterium GWE2_32_10]HBY19572.1 hypothetical protein [Clostridiales bacterium]
MYRFFIRLARRTIDKIDYKYRDKIFINIYTKYKKLYFDKEAQEYAEKFIEKMVANIYIGVVCLGILILFAAPTTKVNKTKFEIKGNKIEKQEFKEGKIAGYIEANIDNEKGIYRINVGEKSPTDKQVVDRIINVLNQDFIKGDNESLSEVSKKLKLITENDYGAIVTWTTNSENIDITTGEVLRKPKGEGNINARLTLKVSKNKVIKQKVFQLCILEDTKIKQQREIDEAYKSLDKIMKKVNKAGDTDYIELPDKVNKLAVSWDTYKVTQKEKDDRVGIFIIGMIVIFGIVYKKYKQIDEKIIKRKQQIELEFCEFLNKFVLFIEAGLTISGTLDKITKNATKNDYLYLELKRLHNDINSGVYEIDAYNNFAKRCNSIYINKFVSNVTQSIKKGNSGLKSSLKEILKETWENRKNMAKKRGEEASTKLIFPLVIIFLAIMLLIIYPAIISIKI